MCTIPHFKQVLGNTMFDSKFFDDAAKNLFEALPDSLKSVEQDLQQKFKTILSSTFDKLDLVTREEFEVQKKVLAKTRKKIDEIEAKLEAK